MAIENIAVESAKELLYDVDSLRAGADLSAVSNVFVGVQVDVTEGKPLAVAATQTNVLGVLRFGKVKGAEVEVVIDGFYGVKAGAAFDAGAFLSIDASGRVIEATSGNIIVGRAFEAAQLTNQIVKVRLYHPVAKMA